MNNANMPIMNINNACKNIQSSTYSLLIFSINCSHYSSFGIMANIPYIIKDFTNLILLFLVIDFLNRSPNNNYF